MTAPASEQEDAAVDLAIKVMMFAMWQNLDLEQGKALEIRRALLLLFGQRILDLVDQRIGYSKAAL